MYTKVIAAVAVLVAIFFLVPDSSKDYTALKKQLKSSFIIQETHREIPLFSLIDHNNKEFANKHLEDNWTLLLFVYTNCPDVCPTELMHMSLLKANLLNNNSKVVPNIVAITFDPARDTPEVLKTYVPHFDKDFLGVSGDQTQINSLVKSFNAYH